MTFDLPKKLTAFLWEGPKRIHLIGVAGSGMSGIAGLLLALGTSRERMRSSEYT